MSERVPVSSLNLALFAALCFMGAEVGHLFAVSTMQGVFSTVWPPSGLMLAGLVQADRRAWGHWLAAGCGAIFVSGYLVHDQPLAAAAGFTACALLEGSLGAWVITRVADVPFTMADLKNVMLFGVASIIATLAGAVVAAGTLKVIVGVPSFWAAWQSWWLSDLLGVMLIAPLLLMWRTERVQILKMLGSWRLIEVLIVFGGLVAVAEGVYAELLPPVLQVPGYLLPFFVWGVFRFGQSGLAVLLLATALIGVWNTSHGRGPYMAFMGSTTASLLRGQGTIAVAGFSFMLLAAIVAERRIAAEERSMLVADLQQALAEIRTLEGLIPICAWCHKVRDDAGFWQRIETYLHAHTQATFSHGICPDCSGSLDGSAPVVHRRRKDDVKPDQAGT